MNPKMLLQLKEHWSRFQMDHPKVVPFFHAVGEQALVEGSVFDIKVTTPDGRVLESNIRLNQNDIETLGMLMKKKD